MIGSACDGGLADGPDGIDSQFYDVNLAHKAHFLTPETQSPYNRAGSLSVWSDNRLVVLEGHMRRGDVV